eukprot:CAMPEP_0175074620 /NCGR_PEP_ID=MMETSP0052_2-20121109/21433_1 /TAXON_ID=51329 ORGANISM="Polytomella parva, Strain SAG 63-3" /NCGR_SAMPLE_ID=MMETSP0052_2 /ASSEMBLY_ACC=CAM_ASM_000194 /LENGTH=80 /DNA_ID=CAMNT_0016342989 /DNA_START=332 /DNA_END=574 /DNA_ORIENTATION=-
MLQRSEHRTTDSPKTTIAAGSLKWAIHSPTSDSIWRKLEAIKTEMTRSGFKVLTIPWDSSSKLGQKLRHLTMAEGWARLM